jgi:hypothetical protein
MIGVSFLIVGIVAGLITRVIVNKSGESFNALFNQSSTGELGVWIYAENGGCPDLRKKDVRPLVVVMPSTYRGEGKVSARELKTCMELDVNDGTRPLVTNCSEGHVVIEPAARTAERTGSYSVVLADGRQRTGDFRATFCAQSK